MGSNPISPVCEAMVVGTAHPTSNGTDLPLSFLLELGIPLTRFLEKAWFLDFAAVVLLKTGKMDTIGQIFRLITAATLTIFFDYGVSHLLRQTHSQATSQTKRLP